METFVVRVWRAVEDPSAIPESWTAPLRGFVEHVGTGTTTRFGGGEELLRFLQNLPAPADSETAETRAPSEEGDR
ncbi:MAG: hypothetical protein ACREMK_10430 [Gemmatimonadota bacterium]